jgi:hypothetical protein
MRSRWLRRAGIVLFGLLAVMVAVWAFLAAVSGELFFGSTSGFAAAPGAAYLVVPVVVVAIPVGLWMAIRNW